VSSGCTAVDDPLGAVDQPFVEEPLEDGQDGAGEPLVHGEALAVPVDRVAQPAHLAEDRAAGFGLPLPDPLDERLAAQVVAGQPLRAQAPLDDVLGGDPGVVHAGQPERLVPLHPAPAHQRVLDRVVERVADVQRARDVGRGQDDGERGPVGGGVGAEVAGRDPLLVPAVLDLARLVLAGQLDGGGNIVQRHAASLRVRRSVPSFTMLARPTPCEGASG
jgi:hypothetical protein